MNTIPSIFNQRLINHTVLGGKDSVKKDSDVTCILLNRTGSHYRNVVLENLSNKKFHQIISIENNNDSTSAENLSHRFPAVKFILTQEEVTPGDMVNIGMAEATTKYVMILYDDLCTDKLIFTNSLIDRFKEMNQFCVVPRLSSSSQVPLPVRFAPAVNKSVFKVESSLIITDNAPTLYAADWVGFYDREKFIQTGGADYTILSPYWQKLDLFLRAWLWGEKVTLSTSFALSYSDEIPEENRTVDISYLRFYLKNLAPVFLSDHAYIPRTSFFAYQLRSKCGLPTALNHFKAARNWTEENKYRFTTDAASLIQAWGK